MLSTAQEVLDKFSQLLQTEKKKVVSVILRESLETEMPALTDEELTLNAEEFF